MDAKTRSNRDVWNAIAETHYRQYHIDRLLAGEPLLDDLVRREVGEVAGKSLIHLLCHIGTDTLSWALLGARVTGVDVSPQSIQYARKLAKRLGVEATFIVSDVMELAGKVDETYDIVFASTGVLCWLPDIDRFAATVRQLLKPGGFFYLLDGHPFRDMLEQSEGGELCIRHDYFHRGPYEYESFTDYTVADLEISAKSYEWLWTLGDIVTAFAQNKMRIAFLHEFPHYFYGGYTSTDVVLGKRELHPCTLSLKAVAE